MATWGFTVAGLTVLSLLLTPAELSAEGATCCLKTLLHPANQIKIRHLQNVHASRFLLGTACMRGQTLDMQLATAQHTHIGLWKKALLKA